ncbi:MAG: FGGY-family carbohydrate kinase [Ktedonobacteraceae bacterium]
MHIAQSADYVIGIDMGTQGIRGLAVASDGTVVARTVVVRPSEAPGISRISSNGVFEQDAEEWWQSTCIMLSQISEQLAVAGVAPEAVKALCIAGTSGTFVPLDASHRPLRPALMYSDSRAVDQAHRCNSALSDLTAKLGYRFNASFALPKLLWLYEHEPEIWRQTALIAHQVDYIVGQLTDVWGVSDYMNALKTGYDLLAERYPPEIASKLGLTLERLPQIVPPGRLIGQLVPSVASALGMSSGILVVGGLTDGCASQFAAGVTEPGEWVSSLGTTLTIKGVSTELVKDPQGRIYCHRHPERGWLPGGASNTGGEVLVQRFPDADLAAYDRRAAELVPTSLLAYPLARRGERFPFIAPGAEGFIVAESDPSHVHPDLLYAAFLEGVALVERLAYEVVADLGAPVVGPIRTVGGATRSELWQRIRASVCNRSFIVPLVADPAMGAAVLAAAGRLHRDLKSATHAMLHSSNEVTPDPELVPVYEERYARFKDELRARGYLSPSDQHSL